jgi:hypothetical protein
MKVNDKIIGCLAAWLLAPASSMAPPEVLATKNLPFVVELQISFVRYEHRSTANRLSLAHAVKEL